MSEGNNKSNFTLQSIGQKLQAIANKWNIVAVVTNQMTTKIKGKGARKNLGIFGLII